MEEEYKSNSNRSREINKQREEEKKVEKVITGKVKTKKRSFFSKFKDEIISQDAKSIKSFVFGDVLIPSIKKAISDIVTNGIEIILYGETKGRRSTADRVSYRSYYDYRNSRSDDRNISISSTYNFDDIILDTRGEAQEVLDRMDELMDTYGLVRVADFYDLVGITGNYTDNKYGWTNLRNASVIRVRDGYLIKMPRAVPID